MSTMMGPASPHYLGCNVALVVQVGNVSPGVIIPVVDTLACVEVGVGVGELGLERGVGVGVGVGVRVVGDLDGLCDFNLGAV